jgi:dTDP-4-dehydrorhamnose reductase
MKTKKVLILGVTGMLGHTLFAHLSKDENLDVYGTARTSEYPEAVEQAIRRALTEDGMVNRAAEENWNTAVTRLDHIKLKKETIGFYEKVFQGRSGSGEI